MLVPRAVFRYGSYDLTLITLGQASSLLTGKDFRSSKGGGQRVAGLSFGVFSGVGFLAVMKRVYPPPVEANLFPEIPPDLSLKEALAYGRKAVGNLKGFPWRYYCGGLVASGVVGGLVSASIQSNFGG